MSAPIRIAIRADAGAALGTGHFARAGAVAEALAVGGGVLITLVTSAEGATFAPAFFPADVEILALHPGEDGPNAAMDRLSTMGSSPDVLVLDHYQYVREWEVLAAGTGIPLLVIDDLDTAKNADIIVRPHGGAASTLNPGLLRGPTYLPISRDVIAASLERPRAKSACLRLNICFGGSDPTGTTVKALQAVAGLEEFEIDLVIGPGAQIDHALAEEVAHRPNVTLHRSPNQKTLAELMAVADLALGAGGVMLWERLRLGVPSLVISTAPNQRAQIATAVTAGAIWPLGDHSEATADGIAEAIRALAADEATLYTMAEAGRSLVDGRGAVRLAAWVRALALETRDVGASDSRNLLNWRTDDRNWQHNWHNAEKPEWAAHVAWLTERLADPACCFRLVTRGDEPVGVVRFDLEDDGDTANLSIYLVPAWHGSRMGLPVYFAAERALRQSHPAVSRIISRLHTSNGASERMHRDAGFRLAPLRENGEWLEARKTLS
jgi:UDP-2,4-diacetamido-2,4,6-trideoxy-beta-L-altropyranose hydrolase